MCNTWSGFVLVHWFDITHTNRHIGQQNNKHIKIYINTTCCVPAAAICITLNEEFSDIKNLIYRGPQCLFIKNYWLAEVTYLLIRFNKTNFFPWNTNNTERYGVNKQNNTPPLTQRNTEKSDCKGFVSTTNKWYNTPWHPPL